MERCKNGTRPNAIFDECSIIWRPYIYVQVYFSVEKLLMHHQASWGWRVFDSILSNIKRNLYFTEMNSQDNVAAWTKLALEAQKCINLFKSIRIIAGRKKVFFIRKVVHMLLVTPKYSLADILEFIQITN